MNDTEQHFGQTPEQPNSNGHVSSLENVGAATSISRAASLDEIDSLLSFLPPLPAEEVKNPTATQHAGKAESLQGKTETVHAPDEVDLLLQDLDQAVEATIEEIKSWDVERKRSEARQTTDAFTLETLARDENPLIRTLAFCNPNMPSEQLQKMGRGENQWFQMIAANNSSTPSEVLDELSTSEVPDIQKGVTRNPSTSPVTLYKIQQR